MSDWSPRPHDEKVEPLFGGLAQEQGAQQDSAGQHSAPPLVRDRPIALWAFIAVCAAAIAARAWML